jgi:hypothetical protein
VGTKGDLGLAFRVGFGKEEGKGRVLGGWSRASGYRKSSEACQDSAGLSNSEGSLGGTGCQILGFPARLGRGKVKGREGEGNWEWCRDSRESGQPRGGWTSGPLAFAYKIKILPARCLWNWSQENIF